MVYPNSSLDCYAARSGALPQPVSSATEQSAAVKIVGGFLIRVPFRLYGRRLKHRCSLPASAANF